jgi:hypothetical protein
MEINYDYLKQSFIKTRDEEEIKQVISNEIERSVQIKELLSVLEAVTTKDEFKWNTFIAEFMTEGIQVKYGVGQGDGPIIVWSINLAENLLDDDDEEQQTTKGDIIARNVYEVIHTLLQLIGLYGARHTLLNYATETEELVMPNLDGEIFIKR